MRTDRARAAAERVARNIIPDLAGRPLYLIQPGPESMVTRAMNGGGFGRYFAGLDSALEPELKRQGAWRGPGVAVIVDAVACFVFNRDDDDGLRATVGTTLHELAHWLDLPEPAEPRPDAYASFVKASEKWNESAPALFPMLAAHSESFTRLCVHLWWRATHGGGMTLCPLWLRFGNDYTGLEFLDSPVAYIDALMDELAERRELPLRELAAVPPPAAYTALWDATYQKLITPSPTSATDAA